MGEEVNRHNWVRDGNALSRYAYHPRNYNRSINNPQYIKMKLVPALNQKMRRKMTDSEILYVVDQVKKLNPEIFRGRTIDEITGALVDTFIARLAKYGCDGDDEKIDTHELLKAEMGVSTESNARGSLGIINVGIDVPEIASSVEISRFLGKYTGFGIQQLFNPEALYRHNYIFMDTRHRLLDGDGTEIFAWNHVNNVTRTQGSINTTGEIRDIVSIKVMPIKIPYSSSADNALGRVTMLIREFQSQSYIGHENRRFHFVFEATVNGDFIILDPYKFNEGVYRFNNPITQLDTLTISFGSPLQKIIFDTDRLTSTISYANPAVITTTSNHNLVSGNTVLVETFSTQNTTGDSSVIAAVNSAAGNPVTVLSPTTFSIPVDLTTVRNTIVGTIAVTNGVATIVGTGTSFTTDLAFGDDLLIEDSLGTQRYYTVAVVTDDTNVTLNVVYGGATEAGLNIMLGYAGSVSVTNGTPNVVGTATTFLTDYKVGDNITIRDSVGVLRNYDIKAIPTNLSLTLGANYAGVTEGTLAYFKDNAIASFNFTTYFNSKRIVIPLELTFILPE